VSESSVISRQSSVKAISPRVLTVRPLENCQLMLTFKNGEAGVFDCSSHLPYPAYQELKNLEYFRQVRVGQGSICWPHGEDFCPDTLYLDAKREMER
jgi:hypothetical protein